MLYEHITFSIQHRNYSGHTLKPIVFLWVNGEAADPREKEYLEGQAPPNRTT